MPDSEQGSAAHAGFVRFPRRSVDLTDTTHCPACFEALEGAVCPACELDLHHPVAGELAAVSTQAAGLIERRWELIGRIRYDSPVAVQRRAVQSAARPGAAQPGEPQPVAQPVPQPVAAQRIVAPAVHAPGAAVPSAPERASGFPPPPPAVPAAQEPRRSSVQVLLLVVGISLVSVAAIFFLLYAFTNYGIIGRSLVIGAVTVTAFAVASLLRRGRLTTTAEGIAVFAVVLVYLDAFAVRANNLFGSGSSDSLLYWGVALVLSSFGFVLWHRLSRLRVPNIIAFAVFAPGVALLVGGLAAPLDTTTRVFLAFLAAGTAGLVHPLADRLSRRDAASATGTPADAPARLTERVVAFTAASVALALAFCTAFAVAPGVDAAVLPALAGVGLAAAAHAAVLVRAPRPTRLLHGAAAGFAALAALALSAGVATAAYRALPLGPAMVVAAAGSTLILLVLLALAPRLARAAAAGGTAGATAADAVAGTPARAGTARGTAPTAWLPRAAVVAAASVVAVAVAIPATQALALTAQTALVSLGYAWRSGILDSVVPVPASAPGAMAALAVAVLLGSAYAAADAYAVAAARRSGGVRRGALVDGALLRSLLLWGGCAVLIPSVTLLGAVWALAAGWLLLSAVALALALALMLAPIRHPALGAAALPLAATAAVAGALGFAASWASSDSWLAGTLASIVLLLAARRLRVPATADPPAAARSTTPPPPPGRAMHPPAPARSMTPPPPPAAGWAPSTTVPAAPAGVAGHPRAASAPGSAPLPAYGGPPVAPDTVAARAAADGTALFRAALLGTAVVLALVVAAASAYQPHFLSGSVDPATAALDSLRLVSILAVLLLLVGALPLRGISAADRHTVFTLGSVAATLAIVVCWLQLAIDPPADPLLAEPLASVLLAAATLGALIAWLVPRANRGFPAERTVAGIAAAPVVYLLLDSLARLVLPNAAELSLVAVTAALLVAAVALAAAVLSPAALPRVAVETGVAVVGTAGLLAATAGAPGLEWLALLLAAVAALLTALSPDGLVNASSPRKHIGWVALGLATAALWWLLATESVRAIEAWVLPVSGVLLLVALAAWRGARSAAAQGTGPDLGPGSGPGTGSGSGAGSVDHPAHRASARLLLAALLVAVVPIGIAGAGGTSTRALVVGLVSAALLLAGSLLPGAGAVRRYLDVLAVAGVGGALAAALPRAAVELPDSGIDSLAADAWASALAIVLVAAAVAQTMVRDANAGVRAVLARAALLVAMVVVLVVAVLGFDDPQLGAVRAVVVVLAFSLLYLLASVLPSAAPSAFGQRAFGQRAFGQSAFGVPDRLLGPAIRWTALVFAVIAAGNAISLDLVDPVELLTVPMAVALLVSGGVVLARVPEAASWTTLGAGLGVLLLPPLLLTDGDRPVWRLVAVGVVALLVFVTGVRLRLQAPVLVGAVVVLVHAATTFAPQIRAVYELTEWWVWAGIGGIPIIVYAALAERSVRTTRNVVLTIGSLR